MFSQINPIIFHWNFWIISLSLSVPLSSPQKFSKWGGVCKISWKSGFWPSKHCNLFNLIADAESPYSITYCIWYENKKCYPLILPPSIIWKPNLHPVIKHIPLFIFMDALSYLWKHPCTNGENVFYSRK